MPITSVTDVTGMVVVMINGNDVRGCGHWRASTCGCWRECGEIVIFDASLSNRERGFVLVQPQMSDNHLALIVAQALSLRFSVDPAGCPFSVLVGLL